MRIIRQNLRFGLSLCLISFMVLCFVGTPDSSAKVKDGGTLIVGWTQEPKHLFPPMEATIQAGLLHRAAFYDTLVGYSQNMEPVPWLAKSWDSSEQGKTWTFHLVENAVWHDGKPLTAEDVKFTIEYIKDNKLTSHYPYVKDITSVETPDPYTIKVSYKEPIAAVLFKFQNIYILPKHIHQDITGEKALTFTNPNPIGSGPFKFVGWKKKKKLLLEANEDYWNGRPHLDRIIFQYYTNVNSLLFALKAGEIDAIPWELSPIAANKLKEASDIEVAVHENIYYRWLNFNVSDFGQQNPTLRDKNVRVALNHAIDRQEICDLVHSGYVTPGIQVVQPSLPYWFNKQLKPYEFNLDLANAILDKAGYTKRDNKGIRLSEDGTKLEYDLLVLQRFTEETRTAEHIRGTWKQIGVKLNIQVMDGATILSKLFPNYEHDMYLWGFDGRPDPSFILSLFTKGQIQNYNGAGYNNPVYDALYEQQNKITDRSKRKEIVDRMQSILHQDAPHALLYNMSAIAAFNSKKFEGFVPMTAGIFSNLNAYSLRKVHLVK